MVWLSRSDKERPVDTVSKRGVSCPPPPSLSFLLLSADRIFRKKKAHSPSEPITTSSVATNSAPGGANTVVSQVLSVGELTERRPTLLLMAPMRPQVGGSSPSALVSKGWRTCHNTRWWPPNVWCQSQRIIDGEQLTDVCFYLLNILLPFFHDAPQLISFHEDTLRNVGQPQKQGDTLFQLQV